MKQSRALCFALCAFALLTSCEKEQRVEEEKMEAVRFLASYQEEVVTKAPAPFTVGNKSTIIAYKSGESPLSSTPSAGTPLEATSATGGVLTPTTPLYLPKGSYDFYSVSQNTATAPGITFTSGVSAQLANNKDYLWAIVTSVNEGGTVGFSYSHKAVGIEINITQGSGISGLTVTSIKFTPAKADASSKMSLATGEIGKAAQKDVLTEMALSGSKGSYIMVPLGSVSLDIEITANLTIGGIPVTGKKYLATIPARSYEGGTLYTLNLSVSATSLAFTSTVLQDWTTQTITGVTLTEQ